MRAHDRFWSGFWTGWVLATLIIGFIGNTLYWWST